LQVFNKGIPRAVTPHKRGLLVPGITFFHDSLHSPTAIVKLAQAIKRSGITRTPDLVGPCCPNIAGLNERHRRAVRWHDHE
jgi:hypothetical protein